MVICTRSLSPGLNFSNRTYGRPGKSNDIEITAQTATWHASAVKHRAEFVSGP